MNANIQGLRESKKSFRFRDTKEIIHGYQVMIKKNGRDVSLVDIRTYHGRSSSASVYYSIIWIHGDVYGSGTGKAGGYGYDHKSAALDCAIDDAGIVLSKSIHDVGPSAEREAIESICEALGYKKENYLIAEFHA